MSTLDSCHLHLIRHGATANNLMRPARLQGQNLDDGLSEEGRWQSQRTAELLRDVPLAAIYGSPLRRARETAETIVAPHRLELQIIDALIEIDVGRWEGRQWDEIQSNDAAAYERFIRDPAANGYPDGETIAQLHQRVDPVIRRLMAAHVGAHIAVVAHNVVNRSLLAGLLGLPLSAYREIPQDNCGVNRLRLRDGKLWTITINSVCHLGW